MDSKKSHKCCAVCRKSRNLKICSSCEEVSYCSPEHQKQHWKIHKSNCKAYKISSNEKFSNFVEASRDIRAGTVIFTENPLVIGPDWSYDLFTTNSTFNCVGCFEPIRMLTHRCPSCKWPCCKHDCIGLNNPKLHDIECSFLKSGLGIQCDSDYSAIRDYFRTDVLFAMKCLLLQIRHPKKFEQLIQLEGHVEDRKDTMNFVESSKQIDYLEKNFLKPTKDDAEKLDKLSLPLKDRETLKRIYGIIESNAVYLTANNEVAGLYAIGCTVEHSCVPNCHFLFDKRNGFKLTVRAARDIKKGEHIATCYSNILSGTQMRQQQLRNMKYITCSCIRCSDSIELGSNLSSLKCIGMDGIACDGIQVPIKPLNGESSEWACDKCPARVNGNEIADLMVKMSDEIDHTIEKEATVPAIETLMDKLSMFLHQNHYHMFTLKHTLIQLYGNHRDYPIETIDEKHLMRKLRFCDDLLQIVMLLDPYTIRLSIYTAVILYEKFNAIVEMHRRQLNYIPQTIMDAIKCLERAEIILINELDTMHGKQLNRKICEALGQFRNMKI
ncbi:SET domain-containing protein SmydA-8-like [Chironomus tepperi]|uniref:SET domain-containing protein SmydA-8-like n=1 Tax=Chironomus tepperi TaxID=113505 RepID=UPI00391F7BFE